MARSSKVRDEDCDWEFRYRYETLRAILNRNGRTLQILSDLEADLNHMSFTDFRIHRPVRRLFDETYLMAQEINLLSGKRYSALFPKLHEIRLEVEEKMQLAERLERPVAVRLNDEDGLDPALVGGKAAGLSSLYHNWQ